MGHDGGGSRQRDHCTVVRTNATDGFKLCIQRLERGWYRLLAPLGRVYRIVRIPNGVTRHRVRDDRDDLDFVRCVLFKDTGQNGTKR